MVITNTGSVSKMEVGQGSCACVDDCISFVCGNRSTELHDCISLGRWGTLGHNQQIYLPSSDKS